MPDRDPRYVVEPGTDGSWLLIDHGADRRQREAIERSATEQDAQLTADALSVGEEITRGLDRPPDPAFDGIEELIASATAALRREHNFNHLLFPAE
ncbi:hypothetical protein [Amycolatopsis minnesotensis]|uniref:Uncharacterized protein n=1 Tax=Amycolatopsis minnesotensis TaxID=337894 RepID=A0ABN2SA13_9PSEU